ncbi:hypothetical protein CEXT_380331 [Caerostris extrusa]|uniref:Uncharacterized protein n=1 Tax=Caerostris extrusa TaxID=172846 RepID=A0AAV4P480_CAEEX|nr:hypothetical protein CEXT_380331 [Caerostris extrusa]
MSTEAILEEIVTDLLNAEIPDLKEREYICKACKANKPPRNFAYNKFGGESSASLTSTDSSDTIVLFEDENERKEQQSIEDSLVCEFFCGPTLGRQEEEEEREKKKD